MPQTCRTCVYLGTGYTEVASDGPYYYCTFISILPEVMKDSFLEDLIDNPDQQGKNCACYQLDKSRK